jgi:hypothetical protein
VGVDNAGEQKKHKARKLLENCDESPLSSARMPDSHMIEPILLLGEQVVPVVAAF